VRVPRQIFLIFTFSESPLLCGSYSTEIGAGILNQTCVRFCSSVNCPRGKNSHKIRKRSLSSGCNKIGVEIWAEAGTDLRKFVSGSRVQQKILLPIYTFTLSIPKLLKLKSLLKVNYCGSLWNYVRKVKSKSHLDR